MGLMLTIAIAMANGAVSPVQPSKKRERGVLDIAAVKNGEKPAIDKY